MNSKKYIAFCLSYFLVVIVIFFLEYSVFNIRQTEYEEQILITTLLGSLFLYILVSRLIFRKEFESSNDTVITSNTSKDEILNFSKQKHLEISEVSIGLEDLLFQKPGWNDILEQYRLKRAQSMSPVMQLIDGLLTYKYRFITRGSILVVFHTTFGADHYFTLDRWSFKKQKHVNEIISLLESQNLKVIDYRPVFNWKRFVLVTGTLLVVVLLAIFFLDDGLSKLFEEY